MAVAYDEVIVSLGLAPSRRATPRPVAECGTVPGYNRHRAMRQAPCRPCTDANTEYKRQRYNAPKSTADLPPIEHGTAQGARQHHYRREPACPDCRAAYNAWYAPQQRERRARARAAKATRGDR